ncbi:MAG TPA: glucose-6-phosphate dehydrogenase [Polyangiaceae bacterium]|nr:glucose-6-phosphate dehydrogenase [Polyangiaceae bacterium]
MSVAPSPNPLRAGLSDEYRAPPCAFVIFGASGDLTRRKLLPALYNLAVDEALPPHFATLGVARRPKSDESFAGEMREAVAKFSRRKPLDENAWARLAPGIGYVQGSFEQAQTYRDLAARLDAADRERGVGGNRVFYLAVGPDDVLPIVRGLHEAGLIRAPSRDKGAAFSRVVVEKPFGDDLPSARALNRELYRYLDESQAYRIDHYLGKETVQNMIVLRFSNGIFEPLWNSRHVSRVEITVAEDIGVEGRGKFYEKVGITRDIVQNHLLQLLTIVAMEPPVAMDADALRDEKVKVLRALRPLAGRQVLHEVVRGQYGRGVVRGDAVPAYREEPDVPAGSTTDTYVAMRALIDNWRWAGVPFYLRAGKRLAKRVAEVAVHFRSPPLSLFRGAQAAGANALVMRVQPDEGIALRFATKVPGAAVAMREVAMDFRYGAAFGTSGPEAYERLLLDAMRGDATLFTRADEVEAQWGFIDPILEAWREHDAPLRAYDAGSWGPREADELVGRDGAAWRRP